jgi:hypothetical protein
MCVMCARVLFMSVSTAQPLPPPRVAPLQRLGGDNPKSRRRPLLPLAPSLAAARVSAPGKARATTAAASPSSRPWGGGGAASVCPARSAWCGWPWQRRRRAVAAVDLVPLSPDPAGCPAAFSSSLIPSFPCPPSSSAAACPQRRYALTSSGHAPVGGSWMADLVHPHGDTGSCEPAGAGACRSGCGAS